MEICMTEKENRTVIEALDARIAEFTAARNERAVSSDSLVEPGNAAPAETAAEPKAAETTTEAELSPVFKELAMPTLPVLERANRAQLQMQSPNRLYFYWSVKEDPFHTLKKAFGPDAGNYMLAAKLVDVDRGVVEVNPIDHEGSLWFDVDAGGEYRVELGFYSPSRPFVRIMFSNSIETPAKRPSRRPSSESEWHVSADRFADVLNVSGFRQDAFDVALTGDDHEAADAAAYAAFAKMTGQNPNVADLSGEDMRYALFAIAAGVELEQLRYRIGPRLFAVLERRASFLTTGSAKEAILEQFGPTGDEIVEEIAEEEYGSAVFGASLINFPKRFKRTRSIGGFEPISSFDLGSR